MNKIAKRIVAGASAMILALGNMAMTVSATSGTGKVNGVPVTYSTSITATSTLSTSSFQEDPTKHDFKLAINVTYQYINKNTNDRTTAKLQVPVTVGGGIGRQTTAPTNCTMVYAKADHYFEADDEVGWYHSEAIR